MDIQLENKFFNFDNYNILILGGNSGFGFEILKLFSKYNNKIFIVGRNSSKLANAKSSFENKYQNKKILTIKSDLKTENNVKSLFKLIKSKKTNKIDIIINCIGINKRNSIEKLSYKDWQDVINTNLNIAFLISKYGLPFLKNQKFPRYINFTSIFSTVSFEDRTPYSSSKGGLLMLTKHLL